MDIPPGLEGSKYSTKVCKLKISLYGLNQSPRVWFDKFAKSMKKFGYTRCQADHILFLNGSNEGKIYPDCLC